MGKDTFAFWIDKEKVLDIVGHRYSLQILQKTQLVRSTKAQKWQIEKEIVYFEIWQNYRWEHPE